MSSPPHQGRDPQKTSQSLPLGEWPHPKPKFKSLPSDLEKHPSSSRCVQPLLSQTQEEEEPTSSACAEASSPPTAQVGTARRAWLILLFQTVTPVSAAHQDPKHKCSSGK